MWLHTQRWITRVLLGAAITWVVGVALTTAMAAPGAETRNLARREPLKSAATQPAPIRFAALPTTLPTPADIDAMIAGLSADTWKQRQASQEQLVQNADQVESRLEKLVSTSRDQEALSGAQAVLRMIADNRLVGTTLVTLQGQDLSAAAAVLQLSQAANVNIDVEPAELWRQKQWPTVTIAAVRRPFWSVLQQVCKQVGVEPDMTAGTRLRLMEGAGEWVNFPSMVSGPFLIQANNITQTNSVRFSQPGNVERTCNLQISAFAEPKLRLVPDQAVATIEEAVDEKGHTLLNPTNETNEPSLTNSVGRQWELDVELVYPKNAGHKIARLRGALHFIVPTKIQSMQFEQLLSSKGVMRSVGGRRVLVRKTHGIENGGYEVQVTIFRDLLNDDEWQQMNNPRECARLLDDHNHAIPFSGISESDGGEKQTTMTLQFVPTNADPKTPFGKPTQLVWDIILETRELRVPFTFNDLDLP